MPARSEPGGAAMSCTGAIGSAVRCTVILLQPLATACIESEPMATSWLPVPNACTVSDTSYVADGAGSGRRMNVEPDDLSGRSGPTSMSWAPTGTSATDSITCRRTTCRDGHVLVRRDRHLDVGRLRAVDVVAAAARHGSERDEREGQSATHPHAEYTPSSPLASGEPAPAADFGAHRLGAHLALPSVMSHLWLWAGLFVVVGGAVALDLGVHRHQRPPADAARRRRLVAPVDRRSRSATARSSGGGAAPTAAHRVLHGVAAREVAQLRQPHGVPARVHALQGARRRSATAC